MWPAEPLAMGRLADPQAPPPTHPQSTWSPPKGAEWVGATPGVRKTQEVPDTLIPAWHQTPYFWTSTLWPAAELDYGE